MGFEVKPGGMMTGAAVEGAIVELLKRLPVGALVDAEDDDVDASPW